MVARAKVRSTFDVRRDTRLDARYDAKMVRKNCDFFQSRKPGPVQSSPVAVIRVQGRDPERTTRKGNWAGDVLLRVDPKSNPKGLYNCKCRLLQGR